jgi:leucyl/phenylalanyl-tRNA--protein transferase
VIFPDEVKISRSLRKTLRQQPWEVRLNSNFKSVVEHCSRPRRGQSDTWITSEMKMAYLALHHSGYAHSLEIWLEGQLVGGLYGVLVGGVFCGESRFSLRRDASKIALVQLALLMKQQSTGGFIDCQVQNDHLLSMGAITIPRKDFLYQLMKLRKQECCWPEQWVCNLPDKPV